MIRPGHILMTLRVGESLAHVPAHVDCLLGASRPATWLDGGALDSAIRGRGCSCRATGVFHARQSFGRVGEQNTRYDDLEETLGLSRTYRVEIDEPGRTRDVLAALRDAAMVESAGAETLAMTCAASVQCAGNVTQEQILEPHRRVRALEARALEEGDERVRVAIVDTGIAIGHPEFRTRVLAGYDVVNLGMGLLSPGVRLVGDSRGRDFAPLDYVSHGSHVGGIVGAYGWRLPPGVAGRAMMLPVRVLAAARMGSGPKLVGVGSLGDIDEGLKVAAEDADVINMSFGTPASAVDAGAPVPHAMAVRYALSRGCVLVAASGNSGALENYYPAAIDGVIAVGSAGRSGARSTFSTWGPHIALTAPGEDVVSTGLHGYKTSSGTSHAAPFVTGTAALLVARARRKGYALTSEGVRGLLTQTASRRAGETVNPETGHGMLDAAAAIRALDRVLERRGAGSSA